MYAFATLQAIQSAVPSTTLAMDPTPFAYVGLFALAALIGTGLRYAIRMQRTPILHTRTRVHGAVPRPA